MTWEDKSWEGKVIYKPANWKKRAGRHYHGTHSFREAESNANYWKHLGYKHVRIIRTYYQLKPYLIVEGWGEPKKKR